MMKKKILLWTKKEFIYVIILLFALIACLTILYNAKGYENECNEYWIEQIDLNFKDCPLYNIDEFIPFNESFDFEIPLIS